MLNLPKCSIQDVRIPAAEPALPGLPRSYVLLPLQLLHNALLKASHKLSGSLPCDVNSLRFSNGSDQLMGLDATRTPFGLTLRVYGASPWAHQFTYVPAERMVHPEIPSTKHLATSSCMQCIMVSACFCHGQWLMGFHVSAWRVCRFVIRTHQIELPAKWAVLSILCRKTVQYITRCLSWLFLVDHHQNKSPHPCKAPNKDCKHCSAM